MLQVCDGSVLLARSEMPGYWEDEILHGVSRPRVNQEAEGLPSRSRQGFCHAPS